jgi:diphthamide synthase (EF-2-diphthine--ammonia ligase)
VEARIERELAAALDDLETLLKNAEVLAALTEEGLNASLVLVAAHGIRGYLLGNKLEAAEDFETVAEEIRVRVAGPVQGSSS